MRKRFAIVAAAAVAAFGALALIGPSEAAAQTVTGTPPVRPVVIHDSGLGTVSNLTMVLGVASVTLMPRVYYNDPEATVGWKARWHISILAPAMAMTAATLLVDQPIRNAVKSTRPGCTLEDTLARLDGSGCESFGGPSTQAFAAWGATGAGLGIFLVDTFKYSDGRFSAGSFIGNFLFPLSMSVVTSVGRSITPSDIGGQPFENVGQNLLAGALPGLVTGVLFGVGYTLMQRPNCGYGNFVICW
jgi:hypothetical protein